MNLSESNSEELKWVAEAEAPLEEMAPPLIGAVRDPQHRSTLLRLEKSIHDFMLKDDSPSITFPCFDTPYLTDVACILACHYGLEPASDEKSLVFCKGTGTRMPLCTLSSIPPVEPEGRGSLKEEKEVYHTGLARVFDEQLRIGSSVVSPSPEQIPQPTPEAAQCPSANVTFQNQDVVNVPRPREDDETGRSERPNFKSRSARMIAKLMVKGQRRKHRRSL